MSGIFSEIIEKKIHLQLIQQDSQGFQNTFLKIICLQEQEK